MCGIVGVFNQRERVNLERFNAQVDALAHRGPDGRGVQVLAEGRLALGHRRLSIIDLSPAGNQPMANEDGTVWLTFNGEIYNYLELRSKLERCGHVFRSHSDTETIIHAYEQWGPDCVRRLRGIFAFGLYDGRERRLLLARDHIGVKPLYYRQEADCFAFASQPCALLADPTRPAQVDAEAFASFLGYGNLPGELCIYRGVRKLLPGHLLIFQNEQVELRRYWSLEYRPRISDPAEAEALVRSKLAESIHAQRVSDVPIGVLLSGGVDSTIITSLLRRDVDDLASYTIGFHEPESDERAHADLVADHCRTRHHQQVLDYASACRLLPQIIAASDEPFHFNSLLPYHALSRLVQASGRKVVLGGDGADELFAGYRWYDWFAAARAAAPPPTLRERLWPFPRRGGAREVAEYFRYNGYFPPQETTALLGPAAAAARCDLYRPLQQHWHPELPPVLAAQVMDFHCFLVDHCLTKVDRASMACGVEVRVPFLDIELVELLFSIDHAIVYGEGERKALLKRALRDELPEGMDSARKKGFSSPMVHWLPRGLGSIGKTLLAEGSLASRGLLESSALLGGFDGFDPYQQSLLISAELWSRHWLEQDPGSVQAFSEQAASALECAHV